MVRLDPSLARDGSGRSRRRNDTSRFLAADRSGRPFHSVSRGLLSPAGRSRSIGGTWSPNRADTARLPGTRNVVHLPTVARPRVGSSRGMPCLTCHRRHGEACREGLTNRPDRQPKAGVRVPVGGELLPSSESCNDDLPTAVARLRFGARWRRALSAGVPKDP